MWFLFLFLLLLLQSEFAIVLQWRILYVKTLQVINPNMRAEKLVNFSHFCQYLTSTLSILFERSQDWKSCTPRFMSKYYLSYSYSIYCRLKIAGKNLNIYTVWRMYVCTSKLARGRSLNPCKCEVVNPTQEITDTLSAIFMGPPTTNPEDSIFFSRLRIPGFQGHRCHLKERKKEKRAKELRRMKDRIVTQMSIMPSSSFDWSVVETTPISQEFYEDLILTE